MNALISILAVQLLAAREPVIGRCDPEDGPRIAWSRADRAEARARAAAACSSLGASPVVCAWLDASGLRESSWRPSVRHRRGAREDGIGILGLDKRAHRGKWPGDPEPAWCTPEASVIVARHIARRAIKRWGAANISEIQAVYAFRTFRDEYGVLHVAVNPRANDRLCKAMMVRGFSCQVRVRLRDVGRWVQVADRPAETARMKERFEASILLEQKSETEGYQHAAQNPRGDE